MPKSIKPTILTQALSSSDSKVLVRQAVRTMDDAYHPHPVPTLPSTAIIKGDAKGDKGNWTGVYAHSEQSIALYAESPVFAGWFDGDVHIDGDVEINGDFTHGAGVANFKNAEFANATFANISVSGDITMMNADCAEDFNIAGVDKADPGTVMVLGDEGTLSESKKAYDHRVAGVISGAGDYKPGIVLDKQPTSGNRQPIALMGKVFCKADAQFGPIEVGDLLTTSPTPGHAMKASEPLQAFGAVIGKALRPLAEGQGMIPILIGLR